MKKIILLSVMLSILSINLHAQIHSSPVGGYWNSPGTWEGGIIPGSANDVIIEGPVVLASVSGYTILTEYCKNLTVTAAGSLKNGDYGGGSGAYPLVVSGNVVNNGTVANGPSDALKILISGDLENNNIWMPYLTEFQFSDNHNLSLAAGKTLGSKIVNNGASTFTALTDLVFTCDFIGDGNLNRENFYLNGKTLVLGNHSIELHKCLINSGTLTGDFHIKGNFKIDMNPADTMVFIGNITVDDTLTCNQYNGGYAIEKLKIIGDITNNGVVSDNDGSNPDDLSILITGNIINNGTWTCNYVNLIGTGTQYISQSSGKKFDSFFTDLNPASKVQALSDITIAKDFNLNGTTVEMDGHTLSIKGWLQNGFITNTKLHDGYLKNLTSINNLVIEGLVTVETNNVFQNSVVVNDTLQSNEYGGGSITYTLKIEGNIENNGVIRSYSPDDQLAVEITGNITNNELWRCNFVNLTGKATQFIYQRPGKQFDCNFSDLNAGSKVQALSHITITKDFNLNGATLEMEGATLTINGWLHNGFINNTVLHNGYLQNITSLDNLTLEGLVTVETGNIFQKSVVVNDTLQSKEYGGGSIAYTLKIEGNIQNNGVIKNNSPDDQLSLEITGDIQNNRKWENGFTKFTGTRDQQLSSLTGHSLNGEFSDLDSTSSVIAYSDLEFSGNLNLGRAVLNMQNNAVTFRTDRWISNGYLKNARLRNGMLSHIRLSGETEIYGRVELNEGNDACGNITVNDTLIVTSYGGGSISYTFVVYGNIVNKGLLGQLYDDALYIKVNGNIINEGIWNAWRNCFLFYSNSGNCSLTYTNTGLSDIQVNSSSISGAGAAAFTIISGGGMQTVSPIQSYGATIQFIPPGADVTALLILESNQVGSLNKIELNGFNYETVSVGKENNMPITDRIILDQNYPNPFTETTTITCQLPKDVYVVLKVYDFIGREVKTLVAGKQAKGEHKVKFDASNLPAGVYSYQLWVNGKVETKKMLFLK
jgi:hypothetical protein